MRYLLTIAGHDPIHGAGITADLATWSAMGLDGASVITALTTQNSQGLSRVEPVAASTVAQALQAVLADGEPSAIKIGMLGSVAVMRVVTEFVAARRCPVVLDPVLTGSNGHWAFSDEPAQALEALLALMHCTDVITPNLPEAQEIIGGQVLNFSALLALCRSAVVLKGGHEQGPFSVDTVITAERTALLRNPRLPKSTHGTGCVFSAALAGALSQGADVFDAATQAKMRVHAGIAQARLRPGRAQVQTAAQLSSAHLPSLRASTHASALNAPFAPITQPLGFYPVVPSADWVARLLSWGVRTVQLRIKTGSLSSAELRIQIAQAVQAGKQHPGAQVFINDHWAEALALGAYGVHLGQEDVAVADLVALQSSGVRLGVSSHTPSEIAAAHAVHPSYIAIGPVYPTTLKAMRYDSVGLERLQQWTRWCQPLYPVVAIGGISLERTPGVLACGVQSVAVVSAVTAAEQPEQVVRAFLSIFQKKQL